MLQCYWIRRWLNPQMQNCIYKGPIVELNSDFGLCRKAGTPKVPCCEQQGQLYLCWFPSAAKINYHKLGALKTTVYYLTVLEARGPKSGCWRGWCSSKKWGENLSLLLASYWWFTGDFWHSLACSCNNSICLCCHIVSPCCVFFSSSCKDTSHIRLRTQSSLVAQRIKNLPAMQDTWVQSLGWEDILEKEMAIHPSILAWRIPWTEETVSYSPLGCKESDTTERLTLPQSELLLADYVCRDSFQISSQTLGRLCKDKAETGVKLSQSKECQEPPEAWKDKERFSPKAFRRCMTLPNLYFGPLASRNVKEYISVIFKPLNMWLNLLWQL